MSVLVRNLRQAIPAIALLAACAPALAQEVFREEEILGSDRPEAWAMHYFSGTTVMTAFGATPRLSPGQWMLAGELGHIPHLSAEQQQVGFNGFKAEDLNKSPVFGRLRAQIGLPGRWVADVGYTPPVEIDGLRAQDLFAVGIGRRLFDQAPYSVSMRAFGQHGKAKGDITCPAGLAGDPDPVRNPYGCQAASHDQIGLNHYGIDLTVAWSRERWTWHVTTGVVRNEPDVQVDALTYDVRDRSHLVARGVLPMLALGLSRDFGARWTGAFEVLHVPLTVRRDPDAGREHDSLTSLRLRVSVRP
ncbi:hypothetical protein [Agrilutibacter solisilvae]|uniref:Transporter n=1 Tax=Agrilutibacter solisilvae TaxID=2763317 RepID=A0A975ARX2_9GAMM|nr:hypothetical protein [Lysobacter solisilvae]QSX77380.1 hypothetical protein I8J32_011455 [Lysobacter solisilvae]